MPQKPKFIKFRSVKDYIKDVQRIRSSKTAVNNLINRFNSLIKSTIVEAVKLTRENKGKTIPQRYMKEALEKTVGRKRLEWQRIFKELVLHNPTDLGKLTKEITRYIAGHKKK